jgi:hypothetical protein
MGTTTTRNIQSLVPNENITSANSSSYPKSVDYCGHLFYNDPNKKDTANALYEIPGVPSRKDNFPLQPFGGPIEGSCCQYTPPLPGNKTEPFEFDCAFRTNLQGVAFYDVADFARENQLFYRYYREAWNVATENGYDDLKNITAFNHTTKPDSWDEECTEAGGVCSYLRWADGSP